MHGFRWPTPTLLEDWLIHQVGYHMTTMKILQDAPTQMDQRDDHWWQRLNVLSGNGTPPGRPPTIPTSAVAALVIVVPNCEVVLILCYGCLTAEL